MGRVLSIQPYVPENSTDIQDCAMAIRDGVPLRGALNPKAEIFSALVAQFVAFRASTASRGDEEKVTHLMPTHIMETEEASLMNAGQNTKSRTYENAARSYQAAAALAPAHERWEFITP